MRRMILAGCLLLCLVATPAKAAIMEMGTPSMTGLPIRDDLYTAGETVDVLREIEGDLLAAGAEVGVRRTVGKDLWAAGGKVIVEGDIGDDARLAGGEIDISSNIGGDLLAAAGKLSLAPESVVTNDVQVVGETLRLQGAILGDVRARGETVMIEGTINGNVIVEAETIQVNGRIEGYAKLSARTITLGPNAHFGRTVEYWREGGTMNFGTSAASAVFSPDLRREEKDPSWETATAAAAGIFGTLSLLSGLLIILLLTLFTKKYFADSATQLVKEPWWNALYGVIYLIVTPVVAVIFFITIVGLPIGFLILACYVFTLLFLTPLASLVLAKWWQSWGKYRWGKGMICLAAMAIFVFLKLLPIIPIVGWLLKLCILVPILGAMMMTKYRKARQVL